MSIAWAGQQASINNTTQNTRTPQTQHKHFQDPRTSQENFQEGARFMSKLCTDIQRSKMPTVRSIPDKPRSLQHGQLQEMASCQAHWFDQPENQQLADAGRLPLAHDKHAPILCLRKRPAQMFALKFRERRNNDFRCCREQIQHTKEGVKAK